jgi:long-chain acyl-CoA synthetase
MRRWPVVFETAALAEAVAVDHTDEQLLVLPLAHVFGRHLLWGAIERGAMTAFPEGDDHVADDLREIAPTFVGGPPRLFERVYVQALAEAEQGGLVPAAVVDHALDVGRRVSVLRQRGQTPPLSLSVQMAIADRLLFRRLRARFGERLRFFVCGGASLPREVAELFHAAGMLVLEGYGLTETTGAVAVNRPDRHRFGTVGPPLPGCHIAIAEDGEILVSGPGVMAGYHRDPAATQAATTAQGAFATGDLGAMEDGFLRITGRKKTQFKTSGARYVAPERIEPRLSMREGIAEAIVVGAGRPYAGVLLALDEDVLLARSDREGLGCRSYADLAVHPRVRALVRAHVDAVNEGLSRDERLRCFEILPRPLSEAAGELTPTRKVRRPVVETRYRDLIERMYAAAGDAVRRTPPVAV